MFRARPGLRKPGHKRSGRGVRGSPSCCEVVKPEEETSADQTPGRALCPTLPAGSSETVSASSGTQQTRACTVEDPKRTTPGAERASKTNSGRRVCEIPAALPLAGPVPAYKREFPRRGTGAPWEMVASRWRGKRGTSRAHSAVSGVDVKYCNGAGAEHRSRLGALPRAHGRTERG